MQYHWQSASQSSHSLTASSTFYPMWLLHQRATCQNGQPTLFRFSMAYQMQFHHFISIQNEGFAWDNSKHGHFHEDFFPPVKSPIVAHTPWVERNIPILPSIYDKVCRIICVKMDAGVYEWSNLSYHSHWFCIVNKDTTSLHLIHSLEPLNVVTIQHSRVTPFTEQIAKQFAGCTCGGILNLYVGYNECTQLYNLSDILWRASPH